MAAWPVGLPHQRTLAPRACWASHTCATPGNSAVVVTSVAAPAPSHARAGLIGGDAGVGYDGDLIDVGADQCGEAPPGLPQLLLAYGPEPGPAEVVEHLVQGLVHGRAAGGDAARRQMHAVR